MGQTLTNGIYLPAEGERNCYEGLAANWTALDSLIGGYNAHIGNATIHVTAADKQTWNGKADASALTAHTGDTTIHVTAEDKQAWNGKADASALTAHTGDTTIHVTAADKQTWNGKADASALTAHTGDTTIHVTAEDKAKWDTVTGKANDADVVHKSGNETIDGNKTFNGNTNCVGELNQTAPFKMSADTSFVTGNKNTSIYDQNGFQCANDQIVYNNSRNIRRTWTVNNNGSGTTFSAGFNFILSASGQKVFYPISDSDTDNGSSTAYWKNTYSKLINGATPGALCLPRDRTARVDISAYFTATANGDTNRMTAPDDGYIFLALTDVLVAHCFSQTSNNLTHYGQTFGRNNVGLLYVMFPIRKNDVFACQWYTTATAVTVNNAFFIPCKGNV